MMKKSTKKTATEVAVFAALLVVAEFLETPQAFLPFQSTFFSAFCFLLSICIYIGLYSGWIISVYRRIMQSHVRNYLMLIGSMIIFWVTIRAVKWIAFLFVVVEDRFMWYMYYIPMIFLTLFFFFTALCTGENEEYRINKKWYLFYIPSVVLIILILTNDLHGLAFKIDKTMHAMGQDYSHGIVYYLAFVFILGMVVMSSVIILRKFSVSKNARKAAFWPAVIIIVCLLYSIAYIVKPSYGIGYYIDLTIFGCTMAIALLESFIRGGLIHSNLGHMSCFKISDINAQILNKQGEAVYVSENSKPLSKVDFEALKKNNPVLVNTNTLSHIAPIKGGYVAWHSDVSQIQEIISGLKILNDKLYKEVDILTIENEKKPEAARLQKINSLHSIMLKEILPFSERIQAKILQSPRTHVGELKRLLFETSMTSTYIKRKVNLILTEQTEKCIFTEEIKLCFLESFQLLRFYEKTCEINIINEYNMSLDMAMSSFDLYQNILEKTRYNFDAIYITYNFDENNMIFAVQISGDIQLTNSDLDISNTKQQKYSVQVTDEIDSYYIMLVMQK